MPDDEIQKGRVLTEVWDFELWLIGSTQISHAEAVKILSSPHWHESDPRKTAGGEEDHWGFHFDCGMSIGVILRRPYGDSTIAHEAAIYADPPDSVKAFSYLKTLLTGRDIRVADPPVRIR